VPSFREQNPDPCDAKPPVSHAFVGGSALQANQQALPSQAVKPTPSQPHPIGRVATSSAASSDVAAVPSKHAAQEPRPVSAAGFMQAPALQQPNEPNPPSAAFVIVHVETPMQISKKGAADVAQLAKISHPPVTELLKKPALGSTVRTNFTMLGSTLQLEQKTSSFEASASLRVEMLRAYLEKNLGVEVFCK
jgi:cell pole-organizing protein PopZ